MVNTLGQTTTKKATWAEVPGLSAGRYHVKEVWSGKNLGCLSSYSASVAAHDTAVILVGNRC